MADIIAAIATPAGESAVAVVRISGEGALDLVKRVFRPHKNGKWKSHTLRLGYVLHGQDIVDEALAVWMRSPNSYTGEESAELQCHGGAYCARAALSACLDAGARLALPGEFSKRAFMNGRLDLTQAEAVMDLISSHSQSGARMALHAMAGGLSRRIGALQDTLLDTLAHMEAFLDYPDDDIEAATAEECLREVASVQNSLQETLRGARSARMRAQGVRVAILGQPNVGKSSLLNALLDEERAIVSDEPGTTRDTVSERIVWQGVPLLLSDTAGLRDAENAVERMGVERSYQAAKSADVVLAVFDGSRPWDAQDMQVKETLPQGRCLAVVNKIDLPSASEMQAWKDFLGNIPLMAISARTGEGLDALKDALLSMVLDQSGEEEFLLHERSIAAIQNAMQALERAMEALCSATLDCAALDIRDGWRELGLITGQTADEQIIDRVFERFCLGK